MPSLKKECQAHSQRTGDHNCLVDAETASNDQDEDSLSLGVAEMAGIFIVHALLLGPSALVASHQRFRAGGAAARSKRRLVVESTSQDDQALSANDPTLSQRPKTDTSA